MKPRHSRPRVSSKANEQQFRGRKGKGGSLDRSTATAGASALMGSANIRMTRKSCEPSNSSRCSSQTARRPVQPIAASSVLVFDETEIFRTTCVGASFPRRPSSNMLTYSAFEG